LDYVSRRGAVVRVKAVNYRIELRRLADFYNIYTFYNGEIRSAIGPSITSHEENY
jgi:hypothetical protein